jgi:hypothetical protein
LSSPSRTYRGPANTIESSPTSAFARAPDLIEPIVGWRLWLVVADGGYLWLESMLYPIRWSPRRALDARCVPHRRCYLCDPAEVQAATGHCAPDEECECGIYAARSPDTLAPYLDSTYTGRAAVGRVLGRVRLWGKVIVGERGWRAEHAYPHAIYVPDRLAPRQEAYEALDVTAGLRDFGIPVNLLRWRSTPEIITAITEAAA